MRAVPLRISSRDVLAFILIAYAITISPFLDSGLRNYLVLFAAMLGGMTYFALPLRITRGFLLAAFMWAYMVVIALGNDSFSGLGSLALTVVYASGYLAVTGLLDLVTDKRSFIENLLKKIIYAFAIVSILQMAASFSGLPVPNLIATKGLWSYNSLAIEPSQLGRTVGMTMLAYLIVVRPAGHPESVRSLFLKHRNVVVAFLVTMLLSGSALSALAIIVVFVMSRSFRLATLTFVLIFFVWPIVLTIDYEPLQRSVLLLSSLPTLDTGKIFEADGSGASRLIPTLIYIHEASPDELGFWIGYGKDGLARFFQYRIPGFGDTVAAGFFPGFFVVYGVIGGVIFLWVFVVRWLNATVAPLVMFWLIFFSTSAWNAQVFWYGLIVIQVIHAAGHSFTKERYNKSS